MYCVPQVGVLCPKQEVTSASASGDVTCLSGPLPWRPVVLPPAQVGQVVGLSLHKWSIFP